MSKAYFISDVHLGVGTKEEERKKEQRLLDFLSFIQDEAQYLFIVGDLFDAWIEYRTVIPKGFHRTLTKLDELATRGIGVHYLAGNHDYWMRDFFRELHITTYLDAFETTIDDKRVYVHHGDGLARNDAGYRLLKKVLRHPVNVWLYSWLHPDIGVALAQSSSKKSRNYTSTKSYGDEDGMILLARKKIDEGFDAVIMGHRHLPTCRQLGNGVYINLGDWITHNTYALLDNGKFSLHSWNDTLS